MLTSLLAHSRYDFVGRLSEEPLVVLSGCMIWFPITVIVVTLLHWMIVLEVDTIVGFLGIVGSICAGAVALDPPLAWLSPVLFLSVLGGSILLPVARAAGDRQDLRRIDREQLEGTWEAIQASQKNVMAMMRMAQAAAEQGWTSQAAAIAERALEGMPQQMFHHEYGALHKWKSQGPPTSEAAEFACLKCGFVNTPGDMVCARCHSAYVLDRVLARSVVAVPLVKRMLLGWIAVVGLLVAVPMTSSLAIPSGAIVALLIVEVALGLYLAFRALAGGSSTHG